MNTLHKRLNALPRAEFIIVLDAQATSQVPSPSAMSCMARVITSSGCNSNADQHAEQGDDDHHGNDRSDDCGVRNSLSMAKDLSLSTEIPRYQFTRAGP